MIESRFGTALERAPMPRRVGDVRLRHDGELLIGEKVSPLDRASLLPDLILLAGAAAGLLSLARLIAPSLRTGSLWGTGGAALLAAVATLAGLRLGGLLRGRRGFVVNFDRHLVRVDRPHGLRIRSATTRVPFEEIREVRVEERRTGCWALVIEAGGLPHLLVDGARASERAPLERLRGMLAAAVARDLNPPAAGA